MARGETEVKIHASCTCLRMLSVPMFLLHSCMRSETGTGKSLSRAPIFALTNPQYDDRLFIELQVQ